MIVRRQLRAVPLLLIAACAPAGTRATGSGNQRPAPFIVVAPTEPREQTADQQVQQVLNRLAFGARPGDVARVRAMGVDQWIALQLAPDRVDDHVTDAVLASYEELNTPTTDLVSMYAEGQQAIRQMQKQAAQQGDTSGKRDMRAELLRQNPQL